MFCGRHSKEAVHPRWHSHDRSHALPSRELGTCTLNPESAYLATSLASSSLQSGATRSRTASRYSVAVLFPAAPRLASSSPNRIPSHPHALIPNFQLHEVVRVKQPSDKDQKDLLDLLGSAGMQANSLSPAEGPGISNGGLPTTIKVPSLEVSPDALQIIKSPRMITRAPSLPRSLAHMHVCVYVRAPLCRARSPQTEKRGEGARSSSVR